MSNLLDDHGQPIVRRFNAARLSDRAIDELIGICRGVVADGAVTDSEAQLLADWMEANREAAAMWPARHVYARLNAMFTDRCLDPDEQGELLDVIQRLLGGQAIPNASTELPFTQPPPRIYFAGRAFCLTGKFVVGTRRFCESLITARGGRCQNHVYLDTNYLVIGSVGSTDWIHSTHGRKIETAVDLRNRARDIAIISEEHWAYEFRSNEP